MSFTVNEADQRSPAWVAARLGRLTGSRAKDMLAQRKGRESVSRRTLREQLVRERLTGRLHEDDYTNAAMRRGVALEPVALMTYEAHSGYLVRRTGFLADDDEMIGCSVDGDINGFEGIVEVKCPAVWTHVDALTGRDVPGKHLAQITHNLWVSGASWCDFVSFDDRFGSALRTAVRRVDRSDVDLAAYACAARTFLDEVTRDYLAARVPASGVVTCFVEHDRIQRGRKSIGLCGDWVDERHISNEPTCLECQRCLAQTAEAVFGPAPLPSDRLVEGGA